MQKLRTPLAQPSLDKILLSHSHCTSMLLAWEPNGTGSPASALPLRQGCEAHCQLCPLGLVWCGREEDISLARECISRRIFWKSNMNAQQDVKPQQSVKITCYFQTADRSTPTLHATSCAQVGLRLPANFKCSSPRKPKTSLSDSHIVINIHHRFHGRKPKVVKQVITLDHSDILNKDPEQPVHKNPSRFTAFLFHIQSWFEILDPFLFAEDLSCFFILLSTHKHKTHDSNLDWRR